LYEAGFFEPKAQLIESVELVDVPAAVPGGVAYISFQPYRARCSGAT